MNKQFVEEEILNSNVLPKGFLNGLFLHNLPVVILFCYAFALQNYIALGYLVFSLVCLNFEMEIYYKERSSSQLHRNSKKARLQDIIEIKNYRPIAFRLLFAFSLCTYFFKFAVLTMAYFSTETFTSWFEDEWLTDVEVYFDENFELSDIMLTFVPNIAIILVVVTVMMFQSYRIEINSEDILFYKPSATTRYLLKPIINIILMTFPITNLSFISLVYVTANVVYVLLWSINMNSKTFFQKFCKILQGLCAVTYVSQYLASIYSFKESFGDSKYWNFSFLGIDDIERFWDDRNAAIYVISVLLLYFTTTSFVNHKKFETMRNLYFSVTQDIPLEDVRNQVKKKSIKFLVQKKLFKSDKSESGKKKASADLNETEKSNVPVHNRHKHLALGAKKESEEKAEFSEEDIDENDLRARLGIQSKRKKSTKTLFRKALDFIAKSIKDFLDGFSSTQFLLRALQVVSIVVISSYRTMFSLMLLVWLFASGYTKKNTVIHAWTMYIGLPSAFLTFYFLYFSNIPNNEIGDVVKEFMGDATFEEYWVQYLITFSYIILQTNFIRMLKKQIKDRKEAKFKRRKQITEMAIEMGAIASDQPSKKKTLGSIIMMILVRNSYRFSLFILYFISMQNVSIFNMLLVLQFIIFFIAPKMARKYWHFLVIIVNFIIFCRYFWSLGIITITGEEDQTYYGQYLNFVGITDRIESDGSLDDQNETTNILFWVLFIFMLLQYDVYRSSTFKGQEKGLTEYLGEVQFVQKYITNYKVYINMIQSIYWKSLIWVAYVIITIALCYESFDCLNMVQIILLNFIFCNHLNKLRKTSQGSPHSQIYKLWNIFVIFNAIITSLKYLWNFTKFQFIKDAIDNSTSDLSFLEFLLEHEQFTGLEVSNDSDLFQTFLGEVVILFMAVLMKQVLKIYYLFAKKEKDESSLSEKKRRRRQKKKEKKEKKEQKLVKAKGISDAKIRERERLENIYKIYLSKDLLVKTRTSMWEVYKYLAYFFTVIMFFYVVLMSVFFRLSFGLLLLLIMYYYFFSNVNNTMCEYLHQRQVMKDIKGIMDKYSKWYNSKNRKATPLNLKLQEKQEKRILNDFLTTNLSYRQDIWRPVLNITAFLFTLSYISRMFSFDLFHQDYTTGNTVRLYFTKVFINLGVYADDNIDGEYYIYNNYPFYVLMLMSAMELKFCQFLEMVLQRRLEKFHIDSKAAQKRKKENIFDEFDFDENAKQNSEDSDGQQKSSQESGDSQEDSQENSQESDESQYQSNKPRTLAEIPNGKGNETPDMDRSDIERKKSDMDGEDDDDDDDIFGDKKEEKTFKGLGEMMKRLERGRDRMDYHDSDEEKPIEKETSNKYTFLAAFSKGGKDLTEKPRLIKYYTNSYTYLTIVLRDGLTTIIQRLLILVMLLCADDKRSIFGIYYIIGGYRLWRSKTFDIRMIVQVTDFAMITSILQYVILCCNLNINTSPVQAPRDMAYSLLNMLIGENIDIQSQFIRVIGFSYEYKSTKNMLIDNIIFILLYLFMWIYVDKADYLLNRLIKRAKFERKRKDKHSAKVKNYKGWKDPKYNFYKGTINFIMLNLQTMLIVLLCFICVTTVTLPNLILTAIFLFYTVLVEFTLVKAKVHTKIRFMNFLFNASQVIIFVFLVIVIMDKMPFDAFPIVGFDPYLEDKIGIFFVLMLLQDIVTSSNYPDVYNNFLTKTAIKARLISLCTTYDFNDKKLYKIINHYIEKQELNGRLSKISEQLRVWHDKFLKDKDEDSQKSEKNEPGEVKPTPQEESKRNESQSSSQQKNSSQEEEEDAIQKKAIENIMKSIKGKSGGNTGTKIPVTKRIKATIVRFLLDTRDQFLFDNKVNLYRMIIQKNKTIVSDHYEYLEKASTSNRPITSCLDLIDRFYYDLIKSIKDNPDKSVQELIDEIENFRETKEILFKQKEEERLDREIESVFKKQDLKLMEYSIAQILLLIAQIILTYWSPFCYINLMIYHMIENGYLTMVIPFSIFGYALVEETRPLFMFWKMLFYFMTAITLTKFMTNLLTQSDLLDASFVELLENLVGNSSTFTYEIYILIIIIVQMTLLKRSGFEASTEITIENINQAFVRKKINNDFDQLKQKLETLRLENEKKKLPFMKNDNVKSIEEVLRDVEKDFTTNLGQFNMMNQENFFFRLFSRHNKKIGVDIYPIIALFQFILCLYIALFFSAMESGSYDGLITDSLKFNQFPGTMVIALFVQIFIILADRTIILINDKEDKNENDVTKATFRKKNFEKFFEGYNKQDLRKKNLEKKLQDDYKRRKKVTEKDQEDMTNEERAEFVKLQQQKKKSGGGSDSESGSEEEENFILGFVKGGLNLFFKPDTLKDEKFYHYSSFSKFVLHVSLLLGLHLFVYFYIMDRNQITDPFQSPPTVWFYVLYTIYFVLSALQLKYGIPEFVGRLVLMKGYTRPNKWGYKVFKAIPFFFELKTFIDWTFTNTSLDLFQWFRFEDIYGVLFVGKIEIDVRFRKGVGQKQVWFGKITQGGGGIVGLLLLILGPLLLFSSYNPFASENKVNGAQIELGIAVKDNYFPLFQNSHVADLIQLNSFPGDLQNQPALRNIPASDVQQVKMASFSDNTWNIAQPSLQNLNDNIDEVQDQLTNGLLGEDRIQIIMAYEFTQDLSQKNSIAPVEKSIEYDLVSSEYSTEYNLEAIQNLLYVLTCNEDKQIFISKFYENLVKLGPATDTESFPGTDGQFEKDIYITYKNCGDDAEGGSYWQVQTGVKSVVNGQIVTIYEGLSFYTVTFAVTEFLITFSVSAFYLSVVYIISGQVRKVISGDAFRIQLLELPNAILIMQICEGVLIARSDKNLQKEDILYWELIDIIRSPEALKSITDSCVAQKEAMLKESKEMAGNEEENQ